MKEKLSDGTFLLFKKTLATVPSATKFFCIVLKRHDGTYIQSSTQGRQTAHMRLRDGTRMSVVLSQKCQKGHCDTIGIEGTTKISSIYLRDPHSRHQISTRMMSGNRTEEWKLTSKIESG